MNSFGSVIDTYFRITSDEKIRCFPQILTILCLYEPSRSSDPNNVSNLLPMNTSNVGDVHASIIEVNSTYITNVLAKRRLTNEY